VDLGRDFGIKQSSRYHLQSQPHHLDRYIELNLRLPLLAHLRGQAYDLPGVALNAPPMKRGSRNPPTASVCLSIRCDQTFAEQDLHPLLGAVLPERSGFVDQHFADIRGVVQQDNIISKDAVVGRSAVAPQVFEQQDRILRIEEPMEPIERQIESQSRWIHILAAPHHRRGTLVG